MIPRYFAANPLVMSALGTEQTCPFGAKSGRCWIKLVHRHYVSRSNIADDLSNE